MALLRPPRDRPGDGGFVRRQVQAVEKAAPAVDEWRELWERVMGVVMMIDGKIPFVSKRPA